MIVSALLELKIHRYVDELHELVNVKGYALTNPEVVNKSMELDLLILKAMRGQSNAFTTMKLSHD
ncbi:aspartyl-phosphate phosphatase Spo0E family protein [Paenibacillus piri]|uniref:Aspartyl-phosphate phosphatase Spo0E family protein n=1 Tax=Paenibacillus piri TaxID=2547395 RepID=A0A4R5KVT5_9BACL|nr:aspartyl-phosphate phosphatase Spo0E family protein [Paenibacillus piri]TDF99612.1 aspartyl-phosphate phosphatase Spo0E family protein [Paenibacillus piri]